MKYFDGINKLKHDEIFRFTILNENIYRWSMIYGDNKVDERFFCCLPGRPYFKVQTGNYLPIFIFINRFSTVNNFHSGDTQRPWQFIVSISAIRLSIDIVIYPYPTRHNTNRIVADDFSKFCSGWDACTFSDFFVVCYVCVRVSCHSQTVRVQLTQNLFIFASACHVHSLFFQYLFYQKT